MPHDDVFCVFEGRLLKNVNDATTDFGKHIVLEHLWPGSKKKFLTIYAHLSEIYLPYRATVATGQRIGKMGRTSRSADARNWMAITPHLQFEVRNANWEAYDPVKFLRKFARAAFGLRGGGGVIG